MSEDRPVHGGVKPDELLALGLKLEEVLQIFLEAKLEKVRWVLLGNLVFWGRTQMKLR